MYFEMGICMQVSYTGLSGATFTRKERSKIEQSEKLNFSAVARTTLTGSSGAVITSHVVPLEQEGMCLSSGPSPVSTIYGMGVHGRVVTTCSFETSSLLLPRLISLHYFLKVNY